MPPVSSTSSTRASSAPRRGPGTESAALPRSRRRRGDAGVRDRGTAQHDRRRAGRAVKRLTLTFDNGPTPGVTEHVLDELARRDLKATFFMVGTDLRLPGR